MGAPPRVRVCVRAPSGRRSSTLPCNRVQAIVVALSTGPVGFSDGVGFTNASLVMTTCRGDGVLLKPDRPLITTDAAMMVRALRASLMMHAGNWTRARVALLPREPYRAGAAGCI